MDARRAFEGRLSREDYGRAQIGLGLAPMILLIMLAPVTWFVSAVLGLDEVGSGFLALAVAGLVIVWMIATALANDVRRLHDLGLSGWWIVLTSLLYAAALLIFVTQMSSHQGLAPVAFLALSAGPVWLGWRLRWQRGDPGPNRFGEAPPPPDPIRSDFAPIPVERRDLDAELRETRRALEQTRADLKR